MLQSLSIDIMCRITFELIHHLFINLNSIELMEFDIL